MAGPKSYDVVLTSPSKAGSVQLAPGEYKVKVEGSNAVFTDERTRASFTVPVTVENSNTKFNSTTLDATTQGNSSQITSIELGGSKIKLEFGK
jgi:lipopolysaccharide export system protein LptA